LYFGDDSGSKVADRFLSQVAMAQHFLLSAAARSLSLAKVMRMSDLGVENVFLRLRWPKTDGKPVCPHCGCPTCYSCRRMGGQPRWRCKACRHDFSLTSGTLFAWHKLPLRSYLLAVAVFCNEVKGKSMLALSRDLDVQYKTAFVLAHKLREAMAASVRGLRIGGEGRVAEIDGAYFGGHVRPENLAADRVDRRLSENKSGKRRAVVVMRERGGRTLPQVFAAEGPALSSIGQRIAKGTTVHADESPAWNPLHARFAMKRINHQHGYSIGGACTNGAESYFSRLRRAELGHHHHIRALPAPLRPGGGLARGPAPRQQRRTDARRRRTGDGVPALGRLLRILATRSSCLTHPPADHAIHLEALDRALRPAERGEDGLLDQRLGPVISHRDALRGYDAPGNVTGRQWLRRIAQHVVDRPKTFTGPKP
jgi:transposase-like protein